MFDVKELNNLYTIFKKNVTALYRSYGGRFMAYIIDKKEVYYGEMVPPFHKKHRLEMLLKCSGMKIKDFFGLTFEKKKELLSRGALN